MLISPTTVAHILLLKSIRSNALGSLYFGVGLGTCRGWRLCSNVTVIAWLLTIAWYSTSPPDQGLKRQRSEHVYLFSLAWRKKWLSMPFQSWREDGPVPDDPGETGPKQASRRIPEFITAREGQSWGGDTPYEFVSSLTPSFPPPRLGLILVASP